MHAHARLCIEDGRLTELRSAAPIALRPTGPNEVWLVGSAAGPLGGDDVALDVTVGDGESLTVRSTGATIALCGHSSTRVNAVVGRDASLEWLPEPLVITARTHHVSSASIGVGAGAGVVWREELLLGRNDERPGTCELTLRADLDGTPLLRHRLAIGTPGYDSPAGVGAYRAIGLVLVVDPALAGSTTDLFGDARAAVLPLDIEGAAIVTAVAHDAVTLRALLDEGVSRVRERLPV